ncbi:MAG: DNA modification methylase [Patescibacteria group bacterium]
MNKNKLKIEYVDIKLLKTPKYNPRSWSDTAKENLTESLSNFDVVEPLVVNSSPNRKNIIVGGNFRKHILEQLGHKEVPVVYVDIPDIEKEKELNLRLNRNTGDWDYDLLKEFDPTLLLDVGFDSADLSNIWDDVLSLEEDDFDVEEELSLIKDTNVREGQVFQLGRHRLICGDSAKAETLTKLLHDTKIDVFYSDPPYNISLDYNKGIGTKGKYGGTKVNDSKDRTGYKEFLTSCVNNAKEYLKKDAHIFTWCDENYIGLLQEIYSELEIQHKRVCLWLKNNQNVTPQIAFNKAYEPCVYGTIGKPFLNQRVTNLNEVLNKEVGTGNRLLDDVEDYLNIWLSKRLPSNQYEHPTEKPVTLHEKPLRRCTKPGDKVLDLFGGSGSTLIACEQLNRTAYLVELDPVFCDLIIRRYERLTHDKAKLIN